MAPMARMRRVLPILPILVILAGCGIRVSDPEPGTEFWSDIDIVGTRETGSTMQVIAGYEQWYPVDVETVCELRQNKQTLREIGSTTVPALSGGNPEATPVVGHMTYDFTIDEPGTYIVECLTPKDEDNFIGDEITVSGG
jgi:hypothetical protein